MRQITTDELITFAAANEATTFKTMTGGSPFTVKSEMDGITFYPVTGLGRPNNRGWIDRYVAVFNREQNYVTTPYVESKLRSSSYFIALVNAMLEDGPLKRPETSFGKPNVEPPPDIEGQLLSFLAHTNQGGHAERNSDYIAYYYGFRGHPLPTLEETGSAEGITRERVRQILDTNFRTKVTAADLPALGRAQELLGSAAPLPADEWLELLRGEGLLAGDCSPAGLLRLIHEVTHDESVELFDQDLRPTPSSQTIEAADELFFLPVAGVEEVRGILHDAKTLPGQIGIAKFSYLEQEVGIGSGRQLEVVRRLVELSPQFWTKRDGHDLWYLCEERENTLITNLLKVYGVTGSCGLEELAAALHRALKSRSLKNPVAEPGVIADYLRQCTYVDVRDGVVHFRKEKCIAVELTGPQEAVRRVLEQFGPNGATVPQLKDKLAEIAGEFSGAVLQKAIMNSPIVWVSGERGERVYRLLAHAVTGREADEEERRLERYRQLLRNAGEPGTDAPAKFKRRREQGYLAEFVFGSASEESCAICQVRYPVTALVAAHKKLRSRCTHTERIDPRIVMPLCLLGCDHLYERNLIYVAGGIVRANPIALAHPGLRDRVASLDGKKISEKWKKGPDYFRGLEDASG